MEQVFERYELKYCISNTQYLDLLNIMRKHMKQDSFKKHTISNIYFDTPDYLLIRRSLEKPAYKEKLRVRGYGEFNSCENVFIELKKKYNGIVYKRRLKLAKKDALDFLINNNSLENSSQTINELKYFLDFYKNLSPAIFLTYEREAFFGVLDKDFRMTFDHNIRFKKNISDNDQFILDNDNIILEVKTGLGLPTWLLDFFSKEQILKTSFSKYGTAYTNFLITETEGAIDVA